MGAWRPSVFVAWMCLLGVPGAVAQPRQEEETATVHCCYPRDASGELTGRRFVVPLDTAALRGVQPQGGAVETVRTNGPSSNRVDLVIVGDGYQESQLASYAQRVESIVADMFTEQLYGAYASYFNVHRVDVISSDSGVDHDPSFPIWRDTALNMGFWCNGTERALCVDVSLAWAHAAAAPDVDQILAIANSTKYGGVGYVGADVATTSSNNSLTVETVRHELGHTFAKLADEYFYDGDTYTGAEPAAPNVSILNAQQMASANKKWARWLGLNYGPQWDGVVSAFEGGMYNDFGIFRPSENSKMRTLNRPFNLPSAEAFIIEVYKRVKPIDDATPPGENLPITTNFYVTPMQPSTHSLSVQWYLNGQPIEGATSTTFSFSGSAFATDTESNLLYLSVEVQDRTSLVRDDAARQQFMTQRRSWTVVTLIGDLNGDARVNGADIAILLSGWGEDAGFGADLDDNGFVNGADLAMLLANWTG